MDKEVFVERSVLDSILSYARMFHPRESILLLKGRIEKTKIVVNDIQIPPLASHGSRFSSFPLSRLPIDFSVVGVTHSHPSGTLRPSNSDLNHFYGRIMLITGYPYQSEHNMVILNREGKKLKYEVI